MKKLFYCLLVFTLLAPVAQVTAQSTFGSPELRQRVELLRAKLEKQERERSKTASKLLKKDIVKKTVPAVAKKITTIKQDPISPTIPIKDTPIKETTKEVIKDQTVALPVDLVKPNIVQYNIDEATKATTKAGIIKANNAVQKNSSVLMNLGSAVWLSVEGAYNIIISWLK